MTNYYSDIDNINSFEEKPKVNTVKPAVNMEGSRCVQMCTQLLAVTLTNLGSQILHPTWPRRNHDSKDLIPEEEISPWDIKVTALALHDLSDL